MDFQHEQVLLFWVNRLSFIARKELQSRFSAAGHLITAEEWACLLILWRRDEILPSEIADATTRDRTTTTRLIDRLERKSLVSRNPDKRDGRRVIVKLTSQGSDLQGHLVPIAQEFVSETLQGIEPEALATTLDVLKTVSANILKIDR